MLISTLNKVNFAPSSEVAEIVQNVQTILSTYKGSVVLDRDFGVSADMVDAPINAVKAQLTSEYILAIKEYEPRVEVESIDFNFDDDGKVTPIVEVNIIET